MRLPVRTIRSGPGSAPLLVGIVNVTPDSFSDGGLYATPERAAGRAHALVEAGADWLDVGGESTRPGAAFVDVATEAQRVVPVIAELSRSTTAPMSIDTTKAGVAAAALEAGATVVNDVSGGLADGAMLTIARAAGATIVLGHWPRYLPEELKSTSFPSDSAQAVLAELERIATRAVDHGVDPSRLVLDPGIGFDKRPELNMAILSALKSWRDTIGLPVMVGVSRKRFLAHRTAATPVDRDYGTSALHSQIVSSGGVDAIRAHNVIALRQSVDVALSWTRAEMICRVAARA